MIGINPNHVLQSTPITYDNEETKQKHVKIMKERDKVMQERIKQLGLNDNNDI